MLMDSHSVVFHRYQAGTKDALGNLTSTTEVSGFPQNVKGLFDQSASSRGKNPDGLRDKRDAILYSENGIGRKGDYVVFRGSTYLVLASPRDRRQEIGPSYFEYDLALTGPGNDAKYNAGESKVNPRV